MQFVTLNRLTTAVKFHIVTHVYGPTSANFSLPRPLCSRLRPDVCDRQTSDRQTSDAHHDANPNLCLYVSDKLTVSPSSLNAPTGTLKTREWKTGYREKYGGGKRGTGKRGTKFSRLEKAGQPFMERETDNNYRCTVYN